MAQEDRERPYGYDADLRSQEPDQFGIEISFPPHSEAPARIFRTMNNLIEAFQEIDRQLAVSVRSEIEPVMLLEGLETGSLRIWLRNALETMDDDSLKSGEWKRIVGGFLVRAKRMIIDWAEKKPITSAAQLEELRQRILDEAALTDVLTIPAYVPIPRVEVARSLELIANAVKPLNVNEAVRYLSSEPPVNITRSIGLVPEVLTDILVKESVESSAQMILMVKRPDFLGEARWEFRHGKEAIEAKIVDEKWLAQFRSGEVLLKPGDAFRAIVISVARYGYDGELVDSKHEIDRVIEVIRANRPSQRGLFMSEETH